MSESRYEAFLSSNETPIKTRRFDHGSDSLTLDKRAVVVLTRLPEYVIGALLPVTEQFNNEPNCHGNSDSDMLWEPEEDSGDSDFSVSKSEQKISNSPKCDTKSLSSPGTSRSSDIGKVDKPLFCLTQF